MVARLLVESLRRRPRRKLLALAAITLGVLATTALTHLLLLSGDQMAAALASYGANLRISPHGDAATFPVDELAQLDTIFWRHNLVAIAPLFPLRVRVADADTVAPLVGTWFDHQLAHWRTGLPHTRPSLQVDGRWPQDGAAEVALGRRLARRLEAAVGDRLAIELGGRQQDLAVVGIVGGGGEEEEQAFAPLTVAQALAGRPGAATAAEVFALTVPETDFGRRDPRTLSAEEYDSWYCTAYPSAVALQIDEALPGAGAEVVRQVAGASAAVLLRLRAVFVALGAIVLGGALLAMGAAMSATVLERRREVALLAALGAERRFILGLHLAEAALLGALGGLLGGAGGVVLGHLLAERTFGIGGGWSPTLLPLAIAVGVAVAVAGTVRALHQSLSGEPALLLAGGRG